MRSRLLGLRYGLAIFSLCLLIIPVALAQQVDQALYTGLRWRMIGPFRGGRALAVSGITGDPNIYYFGGVGSGVWKTTNGGQTWHPIFDTQPIASIGAIAVAPSDPNIIYVGSGEADMRSDISFGNGVYKSTDAGKTWQHVGLDDSRQIGRILVDPRDPNRVLVAALGHAYGPNPERGVYLSVDGAKTWQKVLSKGDTTGAIDLAAAPANFAVVYASLWSARRTPWTQYPPSPGGGASGLYKSTDSGATWKEISGGGFPSKNVGRIGIAVAGGDGARVYAIVDATDGGVYRSDDAGATWQQVNKDPRVSGRGWYFSGIFADPRDPDVVYVVNTSIYRSRDGGATFDAIKGAPGGDDYHSLWIAPQNPRRMILGSDQGVAASVDYGSTWSSWYNQPTAQIYHVATDHQFPYHIYGSQQDSGTIGTTSRSDYGHITFRDWFNVGAGESGYIVPDPLDPEIIYGGGTYGELFRFDRRTSQALSISPLVPGSAPGVYRFTWTSPVAFSPQDPHTLYFGSQYVMKTADAGQSWEKISPDLTVAEGQPPASILPDPAAGKNRGVVYAIAPSPVRAGQIWAGTDNGLIQLTRDAGKTWKNVTPKGLSEWSKIGILEASHFDAGTAYAAVDRHRIEDQQPHIYRTHDFGQTWEEISAGLPPTSYANVVREDPVRRGLLYAGTETGIWFSLDDGGHWQSLQQNLPANSVRDIAVEQNDLIIATHGRSFWVMDDISPLRQLTPEVASADAYLFAPRRTVRIRANENNDTPLPPEVPAGENPPPGAIIYYYLRSDQPAAVSLTIADATGRVVRKYSSDDKLPRVAPPNFPTYWLKPTEALEKTAGMHRFIWDLRSTSPDALRRSYSMEAILGRDTPQDPRGALSLPGKYQVTLTVSGKTLSEPLTLVMDPRVKTSEADLEKQSALESQIADALAKAFAAFGEVNRLRAQIKMLSGASGSNGAAGAAAALQALDRKAAALVGETGVEVFPPPPTPPSLNRINDALSRLATAVDGADSAPTAQARETYATLRAQLNTLLAQWTQIKQTDLPQLNSKLRETGTPPLNLNAK